MVSMSEKCSFSQNHYFKRYYRNTLSLLRNTGTNAIDPSLFYEPLFL